MSMNLKQQNYLNKLLSKVEESKKFFEKFIGEDNDASLILKWMIDNDINAYNVFPGYFASNFYSLPGIDVMYSILTHALFDDGDIEFLKITKIYSSGYKSSEYPKIVFDWRGQDNFYENVKEVLQLTDKDIKSDEVSYEFEIISNTQEYIQEYERVKKENKELYEEHQKLIEVSK